MNPVELKIARMRAGFTQTQMAKAIGITVNTYHLKELGRAAFSDDQKIAVTELLQLNLTQFNEIFFDGRLPAGEISRR